MNNEPLRLRHQQSVMLNSHEKCPSTKRRRHWRPGGPAGAELGLTCGSRPCSTVWCLWRSRWRWAAAGTRRTAGTPRARTRRSPAGGSGLRWSACSPHTRRAGGGQRLEERGAQKNRQNPDEHTEPALEEAVRASAKDAAILSSRGELTPRPRQRFIDTVVESQGKEKKEGRGRKTWRRYRYSDDDVMRWMKLIV